MRLNKKLAKTAAVMIAVTVITTSGASQVIAATSSKTTSSKEESGKKDKNTVDSIGDELTDMINSQLDDSQEESADKDETVYVISDTSGNTKNIIVSEKLNNKKESELINDATDLTDIINLKGDETFTSGTGNQIVWDAKGNDISYQGTSTKQLPVDMKVSYKLDGKSVSGDELAGKSGKVTIRFDYTNNTSQNVRIDNKTYKVKTPFAAVTGVVLPEGTFSNIEVTNGRIISLGDSNAIMGITLPGFKESITSTNKDAADDLNIPEYFEITADAKDFEMDMSMTFLTTSVFNNININDLSSLDDLQDAMDELSDASNKLVDATDKLSTGAVDLKDGVSKYTDGVNTLAEGTMTLKNSARTLIGAMDTLTSGMNTISGKFTDNDGLLAGTKTLNSGASTLSNGASTLNSGASTLSNGLSTLNSGVKQLDNSLNAGITDDEKAAAQSSVDEQFGSADDPNSYYNQVANQAAASFTSTVTGSDQLSAGVNSGLTDYTYAMTKEAFIQSYCAINQVQASNEVRAALDEQADAFAAQMTSGMSGNISSTSDTIISSIASGVSSGIGASVADSVKQAALTGVENGIDSTKSTIASQIESQGLVSGASDLAAGASDLASGVSDLASGASDLADGASTLESGVNKIYDDGIEPLTSGINEISGKMPELSNGVGKLADGANELNANSSELNSGAVKLSYGSNELADKMVEFNEDGIEKLTESLDEEQIKDLLNNVKAIVKAGKNYQTFTQIDKSSTGNVKFIIKMPEIKKQDEE